MHVKIVLYGILNKTDERPCKPILTNCLTVPGVAQVSVNSSLNQESSLSGERPQSTVTGISSISISGCCSKTSIRRNKRGGKACGGGLSKLFSS